MPKKKFETYEEVAAYLLNKFAEHFNLERVEGKQKIPSKAKGHRKAPWYPVSEDEQVTEKAASWEIDAKGYAKDNSFFIIVECKRWGDRVGQGDLNDLAYRIQATGAKGGIIVSPLGLQKGAKIIANNEDIVSVTLTENSTNSDFFMKFLKHNCLGFSDTIALGAALTGITLTDHPAEDDPNALENRSAATD